MPFPRSGSPFGLFGEIFNTIACFLHKHTENIKHERDKGDDKRRGSPRKCLDRAIVRDNLEGGKLAFTHAKDLQ